MPTEIRAPLEDTAQKEVFALSYVGQLQATLAQNSLSGQRETQLLTGGSSHAIASIGVPSTAREGHVYGTRTSEDYDVEEQQEEEESTEPGSQVEQFISLAELKAHRLSETRKLLHPRCLRHIVAILLLELW